MNFEESFYSVWNQIEGLEIAEPADHTICVYAASFQRWVDELAKMMEKPTVVFINQTKIMLSDKYFDWERLVPQSHRQRLGVHGHTCIYQVYKKAYEQLRVIELSLTPPQLCIPSKPEPYNVNAIALGEGFD